MSGSDAEMACGTEGCWEDFCGAEEENSSSDASSSSSNMSSRFVLDWAVEAWVDSFCEVIEDSGGCTASTIDVSSMVGGEDWGGDSACGMFDLAWEASKDVYKARQSYGCGRYR